MTRDISIVTGGTSGIGQELARRLARTGTVIVTSRSEAGAVEARRAFAAEGLAVDVEIADVTDAAAITGVIRRTAERHGRLDFLYNNAGSTMLGLARDMAMSDWREFIHVNLYGVVHGVAAAYPLMVAQGHGHIVNTASLAGLVPVPGSLSYTTAKFGVVGLSHALRIEGAARGVRVSVVCPGLVATPIFGKTRTVLIDARQMEAELPGVPVPVARCVDVIQRGVAKNRATIPIAPAGLLWRLHRYFPWLTALAMGKLVTRLHVMRAGELAKRDAA